MEPWRIFFPSALLLAPLNVLLWLAARGGLISVPGIGAAVWHGREMLFGYSFAVVAGYLLPALSWPVLAALWLLWLVARLLWLVPPATLPVAIELALTGAFPLALAVYGVSRFISIRRARNIVFPIAMAALGAAAVVTYASQLGLLSLPGRDPTVLSVYVVGLLIMMMGGRLVPTATVGALRAAGRIVRIAPQAVLEAACAVGMLTLIVADGAGLPRLAGVAALAVAAVLLARMAAWYPLRVGHDVEVWPLHLGFLWLAVGCALVGFERWSLLMLADSGALHALAAGGIGTVTLLMMIRVSRYRARRRGASAANINRIQAMLALAVIVRVAGGAFLPGYRGVTLWTAAALWAAAFIATMAIVIRLALRPGITRPNRP